LAEFYLNMERLGHNASQDRLLAIAFQELNSLGQPVGELKVLTEWELGEAALLREFLTILDLPRPWSFIPVGFDLKSAFEFFRRKVHLHLGQSLSLQTLYERLPTIDLLPLAILMNKGRFRGTTLAWLVGTTDRAPLALWYRQQQWSQIRDYLYQKQADFLNFYAFLRRELPLVWARHQPVCQERALR
jgi:hypothetical protein